MKIRNGFVSNSSSSSFIVMQKDESLSLEERSERTRKVLSSYCDYDEEDLQKLTNKYTKDGKFVILMDNVEYGAEDNVSKLLKEFANIFGIKNISCKFSE